MPINSARRTHLSLDPLRTAAVCIVLGLLGCGPNPAQQNVDGGQNAGITPDAGSPVLTSGLTISQATDTALSGHYDFKLVWGTTESGNQLFGAVPNKVGLLVDYSDAGVILGASVYTFKNYPSHDKTYRCDAKATPCTGVSVDVTTKALTLNGVTWPQVDMINGTGGPDTKTMDGGTVTLSGILQRE